MKSRFFSKCVNSVSIDFVILSIEITFILWYTEIRGRNSQNKNEKEKNNGKKNQEDAQNHINSYVSNAFDSFIHTLSASPILASAPYPVAQGVVDGGVYMLKNYSTKRYLTLPGYFDITQGTVWSNNVYQSSRKPNSEYSYAVRINYNSTTGKYTLCPLIFENFGGGYVVHRNNGDVELSQSLSSDAYWIIQYDSSQAGYIISTDGTTKLTAVGNADGNVNQVDKNEAGNVVVKSGIGMMEQYWFLERVNVNPHVFKGEDNSGPVVTKKNLGTGAEWIFQLPNSEMNDGTTIDVEYTQALNGGVLDIAQVGKYLIVKMKDTSLPPHRDGDDYAAIQIKVDKPSGAYTIRTVVIQDAGTGNSDACQTLPIFSYDYMNTVTVDQYASDFDRSYIITYGADVSAPSTRNWEIEDYNVADFLYFNGIKLVGNNFAIIVAKNLGYTFVNNELSDTEAHKKLIEVRHQIGENIVSHENVIDVMSLMTDSDEETESHSAWTNDAAFNQTYLLKTGNNLVMYENWSIDLATDSYIEIEGANYAIITTAASTYEFGLGSLVSNDNYYSDKISFMLLNTDVYEITFAFAKDKDLYIPDGVYAIRNTAQVRYIQLNNNSSDHVELHNSDGGEDQMWNFKYDSEKKAYTIQSVFDSGLALTLPSTQEGAKVSAETFSASNPSDNQFWHIFYMGDGEYKIKNYTAAFDDIVLGANSGISGQNVVMKASNGSNTEWKIHTTQFDEWHYQCENCCLDNGGNCECYEIGFWDRSPTIFLNIDLPYGVPIDADYCTETVNTCVEIWNQQLGINMTIVMDPSFKYQADITINIMSVEEFENQYGNVSDGAYGNTKPDYAKYFTGVYEDNYVTVNKMNGADIGIFVFNTEQTPEVILHELGHALGILWHTTVSTDIMYYINYEQNLLVITDRECANLRVLYEAFCEV